jgi:hypothetical protein
MGGLKFLFYLVFWPIVLIFYICVPSYRKYINEELKNSSR